MPSRFPRPLLRIAIVAIVAACARTAGAAPPASPPVPEDGARAFYGKALALKVSGMPDRAQQRQLAPVVSQGLARALRAAADAEARHRQAAGNTAPPLWQGDPFSSLFEGPTEATVDRCQAEGEHAQCIVSLAYRDYFGGGHRWNDRAMLVRERGRWVVDDIAYEARWAFGNKGTLRANLAHVVAEAPAEARRRPSGAGRSSPARGR